MMTVSNRIRKIVAAIMVTVILISTVPVTSFSATGPEHITQTMNLSVSSLTAMPGDTVQVTVSVENNPGIASIMFNVEYDSALTLTKVELNNEFGGISTTPEPYRNPQPIGMMSPTEDVKSNGVFATLTFTVGESVADSYVAPVRLTFKHQDIFDSNGTEVPVTVTNGAVTVYHGMPGDVDMNRSVNTMDAIILFRHVVGWDVDVDPRALDVNGDGSVNTMDAIILFRYVVGWDVEIFYGGELPHTHSLTFTPEDDATCTEDGNIAYYYCADCEKYFADQEGQTEISLEQIIKNKTGHSYSNDWSYDKTHHWHDATCEHTNEIKDKSTHTLNAQHVCTACGYNAVQTAKLSTPVITKVEYDIVYWEPVENAETYIVRINDNYTCELRGTSCAISDARWNGQPISKPGEVSVEVRAIGYTSEDGKTIYTSSDWSNEDSSYYYVPLSTSNNVATATSFRLGHGYNFIEDPYLDTQKYASTNSVLNVAKLLSVATYSEAAGSTGESNMYYYSSVEDYLSKTNMNAGFGMNYEFSFIGNMKTQIEASKSIDYSSHAYTSTFVLESFKTLKDRRIVNFEMEDLQYCMSDIFLRDVRRESTATTGMSDSQLIEYLYNTYGTHALLGVNTGGKYVATYTVSTNSEDVAKSVKAGFDVSLGLKSDIVNANFNLNESAQESIANKTSATEAFFNTYYFGGDGSTTTSMKDYSSTSSSWTVNEGNSTAIGLTEDGAIEISTLIGFIDEDLGANYAAYVKEKADKMYRDMESNYPPYYKITYHANNGTSDSFEEVAVYRKDYKVADCSYTKAGHVFIGWSLHEPKDTPDIQPGDIVYYDYTNGATLYAVWLKTVASVSFAGRSKELAEGDSHTDRIQTGLNKQFLIDNGYEHVEIYIVFDTRKNNPIMVNDAKIAIIANNTEVNRYTFGLILLSKEWQPLTPGTVTIKVSDLNDDGSFDIKWSHEKGSGIGERWYVGTTTVTVTAVQ